MLVLFECPAGYAVFRLLDGKKLDKPDNLFKAFQTPESASGLLQLVSLEKFSDTVEALAAAQSALEGKVGKKLKRMMKKLAKEELHEELAVADAKLGGAIKETYGMDCVTNSAVQELMR